MEVTGYGSTYAEALADAESKLQSERDAETFGSIGGGMIGLMIAAFLSVAWVLANAALRPVAGSVYLVLAGLALWLLDGLTTVLFGGANGSAIALILFVLSKLALVGIIVGLAVPARSGMLAIEQAEARLLHGCFMSSAALGAVAHILLYLMTAVGGYVFAGLLIRQGAALLMADAAFAAAFGTDKALLAVFTGPVPPWAAAAALAASAVAVARRRFLHPFARHFTLAGRIVPTRTPQPAA